MSTGLTSDQLIDGFPTPTVTKIEGIPSHDTLANLKEELSENAASVPTEAGGGHHGYLGLLLSDTVYHQLTGHHFAAPVQPNIQPVIPRGSNAEEINAIDRTHKAAVRRHKEFTQLSKALKKQLVSAVEPIYLHALKTPHIG